MKTTFTGSMVSALAALLVVMSGCNSNIFSDEVPGQPLLQVTDEMVDFGRVALGQPHVEQIRVLNLGPQDSKLYVYYYLEGDPAFETNIPEEEIVLPGTRAAHPIRISYTPEQPGEVQGTLVIYHSNRSLSDDINVKTHRVLLVGNAASKCIFPQSPFELPESKRAELESEQLEKP